MLATSTDFPHAGSQGFCRGTADPVTIIRHNGDGTALVRRDPRAGQLRNRFASGNTTLPLSDLFATEAEAFNATLTKKPARKRTERRSSGRRVSA